MKTVKKVSIGALLVILLYLTITVAGTYKYLREYGYSANYLPQTLAVYFGMSNGFTVYDKPDSDISVFIGRHDYIYEEVFDKYGYHETERQGLLGYYGKSDDNSNGRSFEIMSHNEWCHWFRVYSISDGYRIEDFK